MGASLGASGGGGTRRRRGGGKRGTPIVDINMTPFIDVILVLLIIFMVAAPLLTVGVPVELPQSAARPIQEETQPITISVNKSGQMFIQETPIKLEDLVAKLTAIAKNGVEDRIFIRGDKTVDYGLMMQVMGKVSGAGFKKIGLVTEQDSSGTPAAAPGPRG